MTRGAPALALAALLLSGAALASEARAQGDEPKAPPPAQPPHEPGPQPRNPPAQGRILGQVYLGERAPDFELDGSRGVPVMLSRLRGDWVLLTFADRRDSLVRLRAVEGELGELGVKLVGVCREKAYNLVNAARRDSTPFLMLADVTGEVSAAYGLYDSMHGQVEPGFVLLDRMGVVRSAFFGQLLPPAEIAHLARFAITGL
jgi:peroxiredoxin